MSSSNSSRHSDVVSMLVVDASKSARAAIEPHLCGYPAALLEQLVASRCFVRPLRASEGYRTVALRRRASTSTHAPSRQPAFSSSLSGRFISNCLAR